MEIITGLINNLGVAVIVILVASYALNYVADKLSDELHLVGLKLNLPHSVRGATFDAIASSLPEFFTAIVAVTVHHKFNEIGFGTIAGSGIFNILLIPMLSIWFFKGANINVHLDKKSIYRDMLFYSAAILVLIFFTIRGQYTSITGIILILVYIGYLFKLYTETKEHQESVQERNDEIKEAGGDKPYSKILPIVFLCLFGIYFLIEVIVKSAIVVSTTFNIPTIIVSLIVLASATSIPDTLLSIKSSTRGDIDGALSNAVGSNIFDLSICLGMPLLLVKEPVVVGLRENLGIIFFLILSMITTAYVLLNKKGLSKNSGIYMGISYACFLGYIVLVGFGVL